MKYLKPTMLASAIALGLPSHAAVLEEVVVTAQKRAQSVQDIGIAVTAFSGDQLKELGYTNAQQVTAMSPGVTTIAAGPTSFFLSVRGVGQNDFSGDHQESPVAVYVDEAYVSASSGVGFSLFDIERAEVLRGPQGTLFGRNATGGLAHYITKKPSDEFDMYVEASVGRFNKRKIEGAIGGPITESVTGRISFVKNRHDPFIKNTIGKDLNNGNDWSLRGQLLFDINDDANWLISVRAAESDTTTGYFEHSSARVDPSTGLGEHHNGPDLASVPGTTPWQEPDNGVHEGSYNYIGFDKVKSRGITSNLQWGFESFDLTLVTDYWNLEKDYSEDSDGSPNDLYNFLVGSDLDQFSQEIRLSGETDEGLRWVTGAYYLDIDGEFYSGGWAPNLIGIPGGGQANSFENETKSYALFGQVEFDLAEDFTLITGVRWSREDKTSEYRSSIVSFSSASDSTIIDSDPFGLGAPLFSYGKAGAYSAGFELNPGSSSPGEIKKDLITAKVELDWRASDATLVYMSYNRGIKAGGFNAPLDPADLIDGDPSNGGTSEMKFDEEVLNAYELGFKTEFMDGLARLNGAVYYYDYQDYQAFRLEGLTQYVFNTDATVSGAELELQASPISGLDVMLGLGYINNNVEDAYILPNGDSIDRTAPMTPEWNINGLVRYEWPVLAGKFAVQADFNYMDKHYFQLKNSPNVEEDGYVITNARVSYTTNDEAWTISGFVNNLTDEEYRIVAVDLAPAPFGMTTNSYGSPRWWGASVRYQF